MNNAECHFKSLERDLQEKDRRGVFLQGYDCGYTEGTLSIQNPIHKSSKSTYCYIPQALIDEIYKTEMSKATSRILMFMVKHLCSSSELISFTCSCAMIESELQINRTTVKTSVDWLINKDILVKNGDNAPHPSVYSLSTRFYVGE